MKKVAKLVRVTLTTRVIVHADSEDAEILEVAAEKLIPQIEGGDWLNDVEIKDDTECPYTEEDPELFVRRQVGKYSLVEKIKNGALRFYIDNGEEVTEYLDPFAIRVLHTCSDEDFKKHCQFYFD